MMRTKEVTEVRTPGRRPTSAYLWVSRMSGAIGLIAIILALISGLVGQLIVGASSSTLILFAIAAFVFAIWALVYEIRDKG